MNHHHHPHSTNVQHILNNTSASLNIFLGIREQNVTFCIDISGSMYSTLNTIKEQLIQYLLEQSLVTRFNLNRLFNLIAFSSEVYPWSNGVVLWNTATVNSCLDWIKDLETKTGTNTLDALMTAFQDERTHAVCLVTDDISDQDAFTLLDQVSLVAKGRPVHCIYVTVSDREREHEDKAAIEFLQNLATLTKGSFKIVTVGRYGVERITPIYCFDPSTVVECINALQFHNPCETQHQHRHNHHHHQLDIPVATNNLFTQPSRVSELGNFVYPTLHSQPRVLLTNDGRIPMCSMAWSRFRPIRLFHDGTVCGITTNSSTHMGLDKDIAYTPDIEQLLKNKIVIARSTLDGYYYKGKVLSQILAHRFRIQFGPNTHGQYKDSFYQDTPIYDIISFDDAHAHSIKVNDKAMAFLDGVEKYAPCEVLEGYEDRKSSTHHPLTVRFANGTTRTLPKNEAIWIPDAVYDRIKFEFNLPSTARKYLEEYNDEYPNKSLPGYPNLLSSKTNQNDCVIMPRMIYDIWPFFVPFYPLYSNILYPTAASSSTTTSSTLSSLLNGSNSIGENNLSLPSCSSQIMSSTIPTIPAQYGRQIKTKPSAVNADCINRSVIGSYLTPEQLDIKIREQIQSHKHLLDSEHYLTHSRHASRSRSRSKSCCSTNRSNSCCSCGNESFGYESDQHTRRDRTRSTSAGNHRHHSQSSYHHSPAHHHSHSNLLRSKSVTFLDEHSPHHYSHHHNHHQHSHLCDCDYKFSNEISTNTDVSFKGEGENKHKNQSFKYKKDPSNSTVPDRFGNPKVSIGLPGKPMRRPNSASDSLDYSLREKINESIKQDTKMKDLRRGHIARRGEERKENLNMEAKKENLKNQFHKNFTLQINQSEKKRTDDAFNKNQQRTTAKREIYAFNTKRVDATKNDLESKEQAKFNYLRTQTNKRNETRLNTLQDAAQKEASKIAFKKTQQQSRNQNYHDRILFEEATRQAQQKHVEHFHAQAKQQEKAREAKEHRIASHKKYVKENALVKTQNLFLQTN